ncbi:LysR family transcriptional regulator (plasmid) [Pantoea sp. C3]|uniref:LysR family transcriptional regulator n=1 Tax=Pantoea phytostimulans TaxID=2769024 RepID=UPI0038F716BF
MITFKQMDAFIWIVKCGSFEAAATRLSMSQSAISKRIHEIEETFSLPLFDRSQRGARLTEKGRELYELCLDLAGRRDMLIKRMSDSQVLMTRLRLGVTELSALTWLPSFVEEVRGLYPKVQIEPFINTSARLFDSLISDAVDFIVIPDVYSDTRVVSIPLDKLENVWMCSPLLIPHGTPLSLDALSQNTFLTQGKESGIGLIYQRYFSSKNVFFNKTLECDNFVAQLSLAVAGLGITYLPGKLVGNLVKNGKLGEVTLRPSPPNIRYAGMYLTDRAGGVIPEFVHIAQLLCRFDNSLIF